MGLGLDHKYLTQEQLSGFENYKYSAIDTNPLSIYIMHPFWNKVVQYCPLWVAPNVLTFVGFLLTVGACLLLAWFDYDFHAAASPTSPIPRWVFLAVSVLIFVAYTLASSLKLKMASKRRNMFYENKKQETTEIDGIDGKQARRTGTSGPVGELFDHGLDSWTAALIPTCLYSVFGCLDSSSVPPLRYYAVTWNVFITFYLTHWEKYNTGVLFLPWGYDLSMLSTTAVFAATWVVGHDGWKMTVLDGVSSGHILEVVFYLTSIVATLPVVVWNIVASYRNGTGKMRSFFEAVRPLFPVVLYLAVCYLWVAVSPGDIIQRHPRAFYLLTGTVFSNITCRLVVAQMSSTRCDAWNSFVVTNALAVALIRYLGSPRFESAVLHVLWAVFTVAHVHYGSCVVHQMCDHFGIECFTIGKKRSRPEGSPDEEDAAKGGDCDGSQERLLDTSPSKSD